VAIDLETWLTRFAAGAGTLFEWQLDESRIVARLIADPNEASLMFEEDMCPITAQATLETGELYPSLSFAEAAEQQGLSDKDMNTIISVADYSWRLDLYKVRLRARLLHICHLEEPTG
jgi:hypothetical protein